MLNNIVRLDGAFSCLTKICEDACEAIKDTTPTISSPWEALPSLPQEQEEFLAFCGKELLPKVMQFGNLQAPLRCRQNAILLVNHFGLNEFFDDPNGVISVALGGEEVLMKGYLDMIGRLAGDNDANVLKETVKGMKKVIVHGFIIRLYFLTVDTI